MAYTLLIRLNYYRRRFLTNRSIKVQHMLPAFKKKHTEYYFKICPQLLECSSYFTTPFEQWVGHINDLMNIKC